MDEYGDRLDRTAVAQVVGRVGAMMVWLSPAEAVNFDVWRCDMLAVGRARGMRLRVRRTRSGGGVVSNPEHVSNPRRVREHVHGTHGIYAPPSVACLPAQRDGQRPVAAGRRTARCCHVCCAPSDARGALPSVRSTHAGEAGIRMSEYLLPLSKLTRYGSHMWMRHRECRGARGRSGLLMQRQPVHSERLERQRGAPV